MLIVCDSRYSKMQLHNKGYYHLTKLYNIEAAQPAGPCSRTGCDRWKPDKVSLGVARNKYIAPPLLTRKIMGGKPCSIRVRTVERRHSLHLLLRLLEKGSAHLDGLHLSGSIDLFSVSVSCHQVCGWDPCFSTHYQPITHCSPKGSGNKISFGFLQLNLLWHNSRKHKTDTMQHIFLHTWNNLLQVWKWSLIQCGSFLC
ncbi:hypothetical protein E2C01_007317 [Portunus trituberculatus]|uniref:Uncharacterized protein n=1 Tax=Portunus trituberculatus TaxID=210409 RepID=A0A5B7CYW7_PORTR|nr:hypothetical protein [Portunus trituberculatus]